MKAIYAVCLLTTALLADYVPDTLWTVYDNNPFLEFAAEGVLTQSDCYAYVGTCDSLISLRIFDSTGDEVLSRVYEIPFMQNVSGYSIDQLNDGGFIIAGKSIDNCAVYIRTDAVGDTLWTSINPNIYIYSKLNVLATSDGGYIFLYTIPGTAPNELHCILQKYDSGDSLEWQIVYDESFRNISTAIMEEADGSLILVYRVENTSGSPSVRLNKLDSDATELWSREYGSFALDYAVITDACRTIDGGYCIAGHSGFSSILLKTDADGNEEWRNTYLNTRALQAITSMGNGDLIAGGLASNFTTAFLFRTDIDGVTIWEHEFGRPGHNFEYVIDILYDSITDQFVVAAVTSIANMYPCDYWLLCYSADTSGFSLEGDLDPETTSGISGIYPNPFTASTVIECVLEESGNTHLAVYNLAGHRIRDLYSGYHNEGYFETIWNGCDNHGNRVSGGMYFCRFDSNGSASGHKMILIN